MSRFAGLLALTLALACGREVVFVDPPPPSGSDADTTDSDTTGTDTTVVLRVDLAVTVTIAPVDTALATRLGLVNGRLPNAQVTARRVAGRQGPQTGTTDSVGQVTLPGLIEGAWAISAARSLTDAERALLDSPNADVTGFGGAGQFTVAAPAPAVSIGAFAGRQGTLVISEAYLPVNDARPYTAGQYIEVHNNSFETLYLDGKILGRSLPFVFDASSLPCSTTVRWREDPAGIWSRLLWAFPGTGTSYPLPPGASVIVATDAIDHRTIDPNLMDLSTAGFEFIGATDVDNPSVPNMHNFAGWSDMGDAIGHGPRWITEVSVFIADPLDPDSLERDYLPVQSPLYVRIPRDKILDVLTSGRTAETTLGSSYCANFVHPSFDARFAELVNGAAARSIARLGSGAWLQRTKISAVDFEHAIPSPGRVP